MRLLKQIGEDRVQLTRDLDETERPQYAILSHTWAEDNDQEVTFAEVEMVEGQRKVGYRKIQFCAVQAKRDGIDHFWIDTCCINSANLTELSESITSMFGWYLRAAKCYVYLSDVSSQLNPSQQNTDCTWEIAFRESRWFRRGWTLQELLAPKVVEFFSREGTSLGTKETLAAQIHSITTIPLAALQHTPLSQFSIAERIRWTENRQTKKREDSAYCLLGIFEVFMPLIYGEGDNAMRRLRREINDQHGRDVAGHLGRSEAGSRAQEAPAGIVFPPLLIAAASSNVIVLDHAISATHDINIREDGPGRRNALHIAIVANQPLNVSLLLRSGIDVHATARGGITSLHLACMMGHVEIVTILIRDGEIDVNVRDENLNTPLHAAAVNKQLETTRVLLHHGADPWLAESSGWNSFHIATHHGHRELFQILEQAGARQTDRI